MLWNLFDFMPKPFAEGWLPEQDGHQIYYYQYGNPNGVPVLSFHGGPGGASRPKYAKLFNLKKYRFIQFDQRGCGQSQYNDLLYHNETGYNLEDAMHLLAYLHIDTPVVVHGASWGSTMALLFAEKYPKMVRQIVLEAVFLAREQDYGWVNKDSERFYPDLWAQMRLIYKHENFDAEYRRLLFSKKEKDNLKAMSYKGCYEHLLGQAKPHFTELSELDDKYLRTARIACHYDVNKYFLSNNQILRNAGKIKHIPTIIVHNRFDFCCLVKQAWDLHQALPKSSLQILGDYGHVTPKMLKVAKQAIRKNLDV